MKKRLLLIVSLLLTIGFVQAQIPQDLQTDTIRGKVVYLYPVQKSEGLYRISKNFGVTQEDIVKYNPELQQKGLRVGQVIKIPVVQRIDSTQYIVHELLPKETLYGLSKRYGVSIEQIQQLNPETSKKMPIGARLLIAKKSAQAPTPSVAPASSPSVAPASVTTTPSPIQPSPSTPLPIVETNEPVLSSTDTLPMEQPVRIDFSTLFTPTDTTVFDTAVQPLTTPFRLAFLLPFMTDQPKRDAATDRFLEFYEGALLALYDAQRKGLKAEIFVYDIEKNDVQVQRILERPEMQTVDAIIGPAYPTQVSHVSRFAFANHIPALIPFTPKVSDLNINPYLLQFSSSITAETATILEYTQTTYPHANYIFVEDAQEPIAASIAALHDALQAQGERITRIATTQVLNDSLFTALQDSGENILIFYSERYAAMAPLISKIEMTAEQTGKSITLFSQYSWQKELLPIRHFCTSVFHKTKLMDLALTSYNMKYKHFFGHELQNTQPRYDLLGYDLTTALLQILQTDATLPLPQRIERVQYQGLQSDIHFMQIAEQGGFENMGIQIIKQ